MSNDLEQRVDALEKDMAEVKAEVTALKGQTVKKPQDVDGKIQYLLGVALDEACLKPQEAQESGRTTSNAHSLYGGGDE